MNRNYFYGASYSPLMVPEGQWESDLKLMADAHINLIRMGDVHGSWDRIEPREGDFAFDVLERFYKLANRFGLQIILSTGASCPPLWLVQKYPDVRLLSNIGTRYPLGSSYHWACIHHPGYLEALEKYIRELASLTSRQVNHFGWQITNEIGFPFLPARGEQDLGLYCYCDNCQDKFRNWTKNKYASPQELTDAWAWGTTNFSYNDWSDVFAPEGMPSGWAGVTKWLDWRLFVQEAFANFAGWQHQLLKTLDADHPTSINTFNFKGYDRFGTYMGLDQWQIAQKVDHIGYDLYPGSGNKLAKRPEHNSIFLDHGRSVANSAGKDFWLHEIESGPIGGWVMGPDYKTSPVDILRNGFEALGHDVKLMLYMPWREWDYQPLHWGALVDLDGRPTDRLEAAKDLGKVIHQFDQVIMKAHPPQADIAIIESKPNAIFFRGVSDKSEEDLFNAQRGAYRAFWELGYQVDFIDERLLTLNNLSTYKAVILPMMGLLSANAAEVLRDYAANGGVVFGMARLGTLDEKGWYYHQLPIDSLKTLFGIERIEADLLNEHTIQMRGTCYQGRMNRDLVQVLPATEILGVFDDGTPAVTVHKIGAGTGVYLATQADAAHLSADPSLLQAVIQSVMKEQPPRMKFSFDGDWAKAIDVHLLETDEKLLLFFSNYQKGITKGNFRMQWEGKPPRYVSEEYPTRAACPFLIENSEILIPLLFESEEVKFIEIEK